MISGRQEYPGLAEKGLKTSSLPPIPPRLSHVPPRTQRTDGPYAHLAGRRGGKSPHVASGGGGGSRWQGDSTSPRPGPWPAAPARGHRDPGLPFVAPSSGFRDSRRGCQTAGQVRGDRADPRGCLGRRRHPISSLDAHLASLVAPLG